MHGIYKINIAFIKFQLVNFNINTVILFMIFSELDINMQVYFYKVAGLSFILFWK